VSSPDPSESGDRVVVEFPAAEGYRGVGRLVLGGLSSRFELPVDRVEELLLALESLITQELAGDTVTMEATAGSASLTTRVGPFAGSQLSDESVARVLRALVDDVAEEDGPGGYWVELGVAAGRSGGE
jgi:hypothetical protein